MLNQIQNTQSVPKRLFSEHFYLINLNNDLCILGNSWEWINYILACIVVIYRIDNRKIDKKNDFSTLLYYFPYEIYCNFWDTLFKNKYSLTSKLIYIYKGEGIYFFFSKIYISASRSLYNKKRINIVVYKHNYYLPSL